MLDPSPPSGTPRMQEMKIIISETDQWQHNSLYLAILEEVRARGGSGAAVFQGLAGYSASSRVIHTTRLVDVIPQLPLLIIVVDTEQRIAALLPALEEMVAPHGGLISVVDVVAYRYRHPSQAKRDAEHIRVSRIMEPNVVTVAPTTPVTELLPLLLNRFYKALPVIDEQRRVLGMVTDVDLLEKADIGLPISVLEAVREKGAQGFEDVLAAARASGKTARDVMGVRAGALIGPDATVGDAARLMVQQGVKRLPVVDREGRLLGIVGRLDILKTAAHVLLNVSGPEQPPPGLQGITAQTLADLMNPDPPVVSTDTPLDIVIDTLVSDPASRRVIVVDSLARRHVAGVITPADLVSRVADQSHSGVVRMLREGLQFLGLSAQEQRQAERLRTRTAREIMTSPAISAPPQLPLADGIKLMVERGVKLLPVVDGEGKLLGVVNRARILQALIQPLPQAGAPA